MRKYTNTHYSIHTSAEIESTPAGTYGLEHFGIMALLFNYVYLKKKMALLRTSQEPALDGIVSFNVRHGIKR